MLNERYSALKKLFNEHENIPYVILRNFETLGTHPVEVLVLDRDEFVQVFQLTKTKDGLHKTFGNKKFTFFVRTIEDNYFPKPLFERVLKGRTKEEDTGVYAPHPGDRFVSYLYHAIYHQEKMTLDDEVRLSKYRPAGFEAQITDRTYGHQWLCDREYFPVRCTDESVGYFLP